MNYYRALDGMLWKLNPNGWWYSYDSIHERWMKVTNDRSVVETRGIKSISEDELTLELI